MMRGCTRSVLCAAIVACACGALAAQASAAKLELSSGAFQAIYGSPPGTVPVGGGAGRDFGFGANLLLQAANTAPGAPVELTFSGVTMKAEDTYIAATLQANKTGANNPLGLAIEFVDFQRVSLGGVLSPWISDTVDRPWIANVCSPASSTCKTDPSFTGPAGGVKIEDVSFNWGPGTVFQGTVWGKWSNGTATTPPCIHFELPPTGAAADQTLVVTQSSTLAVGAKISAIAGKACLVSANNYYEPGNTPEITLTNE